jgi:GT2 family glycosyltransferase
MKPSTSPPRVYVGIVTYNSHTDLPHCLYGLAIQTYPNIYTLILDNVSTDQTVNWLREQASHIPLILNDKNVGFARAHNKIIARCTPALHEFYMPLNPDVKLTSEYIANLVTLLQQTKAGWGTGKLLLPDETDFHLNMLYSAGHGLRRGGYAFNIGYMLPDDGQFDTEREVFGAPGAAPLYSGQLIAAVAPDGNLFDPDMFMYGEDTDLDWRARRQGWRCWYTPKAVAYHRGSYPGSVQRDGALVNRYLGEAWS